MSISIENSWHFSGGLWQDPDLARVKASCLRHQAHLFTTAELSKGTLWTLRGPRRVGKSTCLKMLIADLIEQEGCPPRSIIWTSLDIIRRPQQLETHLLEILKKHHPRYLFIDEITNVLGWQNVLKSLKDRGHLDETCVLMTGSSAFDLKAGSERMAGRKGAGGDRVLLPMTLKDFLAQDSHLTVDEYMHVGGFPFRVNDYLQAQKAEKEFASPDSLAVFDDVYFYEFSRQRLDRSLALELIFRLSQTQTSAVSYTAFAKNLNIKAETARRYLDVLGDAFLLATIYSYDTGRARVALKKDKKLVWIDPALMFLAEHLKQGEAPQPSTVAEHLVGVHLLRVYEQRLFEGLSAPRNVFTWKSTGGNEIDYIVVNRTKKTVMPIEVKFQKNICDWDFQIMERAFGKGQLVTANDSRQRDKSQALTLKEFLLT